MSRHWLDFTQKLSKVPCKDSLPHVFQARGSQVVILNQSQTYFVYNANSLVPPQFSPNESLGVGPSNQNLNKLFKRL